MLAKINLTKPIPSIYNFTVDEFHTYHIGEFGVWVHNDCGFVKPSRKLQVGDKIDISKFSKAKLNDKKVLKSGNYYIVKDRRAGTLNAHGGSYWKLLDSKGKRIGTLTEDGRFLRK